MKVILIRGPAEGGRWHTANAIKHVMENSPQKALGLEDFRMRAKIMDKLEACGGIGLKLEDAQHAYLRTAAMTFPWGIFDRGLHAILEDIDGAGAAD